MEVSKRPLTSFEIDILETLAFEGCMPITRLIGLTRERNAALRPDDSDVCHAIENLIAFGKIGLVEKWSMGPRGGSAETHVYGTVRKFPIGWVPASKRVVILEG